MGYKYGEQYKPKGKVIPIHQRTDVIGARNMQQNAVKNMNKHVTQGGRRPSGVSTRNTTGVMGSYTGVGAGRFVSNKLTGMSDDIVRGVIKGAQHFPGYHSAIKTATDIHKTTLHHAFTTFEQAKSYYAKQTAGLSKGYLVNEADRVLTGQSKNLLHLYNKGGMNTHPGSSVSQLQKAATRVGKKVVHGGIKRGVGRALGYATGVGVAVDFGLAAKWAYDYNKKNPKAYGKHKTKLYKG